jgi:hypothetical protein
MEANDFRLLSVVETAGNGIANHSLLGLGKNWKSQGARFVAAFGRFLNGKDNFGLKRDSF